MPRLSFYGSRISPHITKTPEGFLICHNVPIARTGTQLYTARELGINDGEPDRQITVVRPPEEVFSPAAIASFEGKPVTDTHPFEDVDPANVMNYGRGHLQNIRQGAGDEADLLLAEVFIEEANLINKVESGQQREVSCGYECVYENGPDGTIIQRNIRGNHLAVVPQGRAGDRVAIHDSAPDTGAVAVNIPLCGRSTSMATATKPSTLRGILIRAGLIRARDAKDEGEVQKVADEMGAALDELETTPPADTPAKDQAENPDQDADVALLSKALEPILTKLTEIDGRLGALEAAKPAADCQDEGGDEVDQLIKALETTNAAEEAAEGETPAEQEAAVTVPAEEMDCEPTGTADGATIALAILKKAKPEIAKIADKDERKRVSDAVISAVKPFLPGKPSGKGLKDIMSAVQATQRKRAQDSQVKTDEQRATEAQKAFDARNPHKKAG